MVRFTLRLPEELYEALKRLAEREHRSLHAQIVHILMEYIDNLLKQG
jgi:hypothetical protein